MTATVAESKFRQFMRGHMHKQKYAVFYELYLKQLESESKQMITDTTQDAQIRRSIQRAIDSEMPLRLLQRIVYEVRCEELGICPDGWKLYPED